MSVKITLVTALAPYDETGGSERTTAQWLDRLVDLGHEVDVIAYGDSEEDSLSSTQHSLIYLEDKSPVGKINDYMKSAEPDVVLTLGGWSDIALWATEKHDIPCVLLVMSNFELQVQSGLASDSYPDHVIAVSDEFRARAKGVYRWCPVSTIYQPIDFEYYSVEREAPNRVTMINPLGLKGGFLFKKLAERRTDTDFLAKMGWKSERRTDHSFRTDPYDIYSRTIGEHVTPPSEPNFSDVENVKYVREGDIRDIYRQTKVLLVPSQWQESFGRVVIESMYNRIPVIASDLGGLSEACGGAGMLVSEYESVEAWDEALSGVLKENTYEEYTSRGIKRAEEYRDQAENDIERFASIVTSLGDSN